MHNCFLLKENSMKPKIFIMVFISYALLIGFSDSNASAFSDAAKKRFSHYLGGAAGYTSGYGLSYKYWHKEKWGFQVAAMPYYKEFVYPEDDNHSLYSTSVIDGKKTVTTASFGVLLLKNLVELKYLRFLMYTGGNTHYKYEKSDYTEVDRTYDYNSSRYVGDTTNVSRRRKSQKVTLGLGAGAEWYIWRFGFHLLFGISGSNDFSLDTKEVMPTAEGGIHFRFDSPRIEGSAD
jgi:hypothetical protein